MSVDDWYDGPTSYEEFHYYYKKEPKMTKSLPKNRFYVASGNVIDGNSNAQWKKATLNEATEHGKNLMERQDLDEVYIVKVVRVIRRAPAPVQVFDLK